MTVIWQEKGEGTVHCDGEGCLASWDVHTSEVIPYVLWGYKKDLYHFCSEECLNAWIALRIQSLFQQAEE